MSRATVPPIIERSTARPAERLASALLALGATTPDAIERARRAGDADEKASPMSRLLARDVREIEALARALLDLGLIDETALADAMAEAADAPRATLSPASVETAMIVLTGAWIDNGDDTDPTLARSRQNAAADTHYSDLGDGARDSDLLAFFRSAKAVPVAATADRIALAAVNPFDRHGADAVRAATGRAVDMCVVAPSALKTTLDRIDEMIGSEALASAEDDVARLKARSEAGPVVRYVDDLIAAAAAAGASDIHIEPARSSLRRSIGADAVAALAVRFRIDGVLRSADPPSPTIAAAVISRLKIMAGLDIAERRRPQDGRIRAAAPTTERRNGRAGRATPLDLRVATAPALEGETIVLRLLRRGAASPTLRAIDADAPTTAAIEAAISRPGGLTIVTGPTGAGKTTTLYAILDRLRDGQRKLISIEDPIEYEMDGVAQMQAQPHIGVDFATLLRAALRHDPDAIMVGETRDAETAATAARAALTGHAVLTTLHTDDAIGAIIRLTDMGLEPFLVAATVRTIIAQRLARRLCETCRREAPVDRAHAVLAREADRLESPLRVYIAPGCADCQGTGAKGRIGLFEALPVDETLARTIAAKANAIELREAARAAGVRSLWDAGAARVLAGEISLAEMLRVVGDPSEVGGGPIAAVGT